MSTVDTIRDDLTSGNFKFTTHFYVDRKVQRNVTRQDIMECGRDGEIIKQADGTFLVLGLDTTNDDLTVICGYDNGTLIITAF